MAVFLLVSWRREGFEQVFQNLVPGKVSAQRTILCGQTQGMILYVHPHTPENLGRGLF